VKVAINSWRLLVESRRIFSPLTDNQLLSDAAPGKNRVINLLGHLIAVHDIRFSILGPGPRLPRTWMPYSQTIPTDKYQKCPRQDS